MSDTGDDVVAMACRPDLGGRMTRYFRRAGLPRLDPVVVDRLLRDVGRELREARRALRLSQAHVAARAGVSPNTVLTAEAGGNVRLGTLLAIAAVVHVELTPRRRAA